MKHFLPLILLGMTLPAIGADWPTYKGDNARGAATEEQLTLPLKQSWEHQPLHPPRPAWRGPAKEDLYNKQFNLKNRQLFDHAFHVIADAQSVYFGSSADDQVHCLDLTTGKERWTFFTEGPVRFAPTLYGGKLFVGSDDGHAYCLSTEGKFIWRKLLAPRDYRIAGNNRIISAWPLRTGILIRDGIAYAGAGMFPKEGIHIVAFDSVHGAERWRTIQTDWTAQGYLLLSQNRVYVPTGRGNPLVCDRNTGKIVQKISDSSDMLFKLIKKWDEKPSLPNSRQNGRIMGLVPDDKKDSFATFTGNHMIIHGAKSYLQTYTELSVLERTRYLTLEHKIPEINANLKKLGGEASKLNEVRKALNKQLSKLLEQKPTKSPLTLEKLIDEKREQIKGQEKLLAEKSNQITAANRNKDKIINDIKACVLWRVKCGQLHALMLAGDTLFAGGNNEIAAYSTANGKKTWSASVNGAALGIAVAHGRLLVSTDKGTIHCFMRK